MYTNGLKDRYGSPLLSLDVGDERYVRMNQIEFEHNKLEEKITLLDRHVQRNADDVTKTNDRLHNINVTVKNHIDDQIVHFTEDEKKEYKEINELVLGVYPTFDFSTNQTDYTGETEAYSIQLDKADFIPGGSIIQQVRLPYKRALNNHEKYCHIIAFDSNSTQIGKTIVSDGKTARTTGSDAILISAWNFENKVLPENYAFVRIALSPNTTLTNLNGDSNFRINVSRNPNNQNINPTNFSKLVNGNGSTQPYLGWVEVTAISTERQNIKEEFNSIIDNLATELRTQFGEDYLTKTEAGETYAAKNYETIVDEYCNGFTIGTLAETATGSEELNAIHYPAANVPHEQPIGYIVLPVLNSCSSPYYLAVWTIDESDRKTYRGISDNSTTWTEGTNAVWNFVKNPITIPAGHKLEIYITDSENSVGNTEANVPAHQIKVYTDGSGSGTIRKGSGWWPGGKIRTQFRQVGKINKHIGDDSHLTEEYKNILDEVISGGFVSKGEFNELLEQTKQKQQYYYDTWTNVKNQDSLNPASIKAFQYSKSDFVAGRFDRIEFPFMAAGNTGYLCVQFFNSNSQVIENATYFSNNKFAQVGASDRLRRLTTFTFDEIYPPDDYAFVRFSFVSEKVAPATIANGLSIKAMYINRSGASWGSYTYLYNDSAAVQNLTIYITVLSRKGAKNTGITYRDYDWTPDFFNGVTVTMSSGGKAFVAPTNGWLISNARKTTTAGNTITINSIEFGYSSSTAQAPVQMLLRKGDVVTSSHAYTVDFYPCKSEQHDYIPVNEHTPYDIWKGAVIYDANGEVSVRDLYIPNASAWKSEVGHAVIGSISRIEDEKAFDSNGNVLFNIQSQYITNGNYMFIQSSITSFDGDLGALTSGAQMFAGARLTSWNTNLPSLTSAETMFYACPNLTSFSADVHSMTTGWNMFMNCTNLTTVSFVGGLDALTDGTGMFKGCSLSYTSLNNILNALPVRNGNVIEITVADSVKDDMLNVERWEGRTIPAHNSGSYYLFRHNGWEVRLTSQSGFEVVVGQLPSTQFDVSEATGYIPDASSWHSNVYTANNLNIVSVVDGGAYDGLV